MPITSPITEAIIRVAIAGAVGGLLGGLFASRRSNLIGSFLLGAIGGITGAAVLRIVNVDPLADAGQGFSYVYAVGGGLLLGFVVAASNR